MTDRPCPRCGSPLPDTCAVCLRCADVLAVALRNAAANWDDLEAAVARQTAISGDSGAGRQRRSLEGPVCEHCTHPSCLPVRLSRIRNRVEDPIPGETNHVSFGALEDAWVVTNTATTWARLIEAESGHPIPPPAPADPVKGEPRRVVVPPRRELHVIPADRPTLCDYSWLPAEFCGCGRHPKENPS